MRNKWLVAILSLIMSLVLCCSVACNGNGENPGGGNEGEGGGSHTHAYTKWEHDDTQHWKVCPDDGEMDPAGKTDHSYNAEGKCECGAEKAVTPTHTHTYDAWDHNDTQHWKYCDEHGSDKSNIDESTRANHSYNAEGKCECGAEKAVTPTHTHTYDAWDHNDTQHWKYCDEHGDDKSNIDESTRANHSYNAEGKCECGAEKEVLKESDKPIFNTDEKTVTFGRYPKTKVTEATLNNALNMAGGSTPTAKSAGNWVDYGYYHGGEQSAFMWYQDVDYEGETYRGVYFTEWRTWWVSYPDTGDERKLSHDPDVTWQDYNGYEKKTVYWFKFEPITWKIVDDLNGVTTLLADVILDAQNYSMTGKQDRLQSGLYSNNYKESYIREWLNSAFLDTAFNKAQQEVIETTYVNNTMYTTWNQLNNPMACDDTEDKVFLVSAQDAIFYGAGSDLGGCSEETRAQMRRSGTDYALVQGLRLVDVDGGVRHYDYWSRSPDWADGHYANMVSHSGYVGLQHIVSLVEGVCPSICIKSAS